MNTEFYKGNQKRMSQTDIWTEKYRPSKFEDVVGQHEIIKRIKSLVQAMNIPHFLFAGPAGTGKSTLALIVVKDLYGPSWKDNYLELNASNERGIDVVRQKVKDFARTKAIKDVPFKVIFLDEADALTKEAQQALRRTMENYSNTCRFILSCNYSSKIIDPIQSRCVSFRFKILEKKDISEIIKKVSEKEGLKISQDAYEAIYEASEGDCRKAINLLQATASIAIDINAEMIGMIASSTKPTGIKIILDYALAGDFINSRDKLLDVMLKESISGTDMVKAIQKEIWNLQIEPELKVRLTEKTGETEFRMTEGSDEFVQLQALLASFLLAGQGKAL